MKKLTFALVLLACCAYGCDDTESIAVPPSSQPSKPNPPAPNQPDCKDSCSGPNKCANTQSQGICRDDNGDGCKEWVIVDCAEGNECFKGECVPVNSACPNNCAGDAKCASDNTLSVCQENADGCREWTNQPCGDGNECVNGECVPVKEQCPDQCTGNPQCKSTNTRSVCQENADGCREWVDQPCGDGNECVNGECLPVKEQCSTNCAGDPKCANASQRTVCKENADGCREWVTEDCPSGQECTNGTCALPPAPPCADTCDGTSRCDGNNVQTCKDNDGDGCKEWTNTQTCQGGQVCQGGSCVTPQPTCENKCTKDAVQCSGKDVQVCKDTNGDGCVEWAKSETCSYKCENNKCVADPNAWVPQCTTTPCPIPITDFSKPIKGNTANGKNNFSQYKPCRSFNKSSYPDESGPEEYYVVNITEPGYLVVGVKATKGDPDVHILSALDANKCLARDDKAAGARVDKGIYYIVVDAYANSSNAGEYTLKATFIADNGKCGMKRETFNRFKSCDLYSTFEMPVTAGTAMEAHLVTDWEHNKYGANWWPSSTKDTKVNAHKARTDELFGAGTAYGGEYCPEEGGHFGQGSTVNSVPERAEAWYINMYWAKSSKPAPGGRYLVVDPFSGKTVVAAGGYETGPGSCDHMGGAVYEIHHYFGTDHGAILTFGQMKNQDLDYGPIDCSK